MELQELVRLIADTLKEFDYSRPIFKAFGAGIGPYGEPQLVKKLSELLSAMGYPTRTAKTPDLMFGTEWALEFKIVRPFGDNGREAENWSVNLLHPYAGNTSAIGDAFKLKQLATKARKAVFIIGYEDEPSKISLDVLLDAFESVARSVCQINLGTRVEERRGDLVHCHHQVLRCISWEIT